MLLQAIHIKIMKPILCGHLCMCICCAHAQGKFVCYQLLKCLKGKDRTLYQRCVKSTHQCKANSTSVERIKLMCVHVHHTHTHTHSSAQLFQKSKSHLKSLSARWVKSNKQHTEDIQIRGTTWQNLCAHVTCDPEFVHPYVYTEYFRSNLSYCTRIFLRSSYNDISKHTYTC